MPTNLLKRNIAPRIEESLNDTRVVVVLGARQVGKSTLTNQLVTSRRGRMLTLDDELTRTAAAADPVGFVQQLEGRVLGIDEVQRVPELVLAIKTAVDADPRPGRFLLTGSANLLRLPATQDSLAERAETLELFGFSQGEWLGLQETFVDRVFDGERYLDHTSRLNRADYLARACAGSYPEALARTSDRRRKAWLRSYAQHVLQRDAPDVSGLQRLSDLPRLLRLLAARTATELNLSDVATDAAIPIRTLPPYLDLLETLYLIHRIPAWSTNLAKRVSQRSKVVVLDTGLASHLINVSATGASITRSPKVAGQLIESFVLSEFRRQIGWSTAVPMLYHYREHSGAEIDAILETDDGRVVAIEVKASATITSKDVRWLSQLRSRLGDRFVAGLVLHTGPMAQPIGDRMAAVPIDVLWSE